MNLIGDRIHCPLNGFGELWFPVVWKKDVNKNTRWIGKFESGFKLTGYNGFHNMYARYHR